LINKASGGDGARIG